MMLRLGLIGCGPWGMRYVRVLRSLEHADLALTCDIDPARVSSATWATCDWRHAAAHPQVDALVIATPAVTHFEIARAALQAGKHVLVEKPQTTSTRDSVELLRLARDAGRVLMTGHTFLFHDGLEAVRSLLTELGTLRRFEASRTHCGPVRDDVGVTWDLAAHDVAIVDSLLGRPPTAVRGMSPRAGEADIDLRYGEVTARLHVSWRDPVRRRELVIVGARRRLALHAEGADARVRLYDGEEIRDIEVEGVEPLRAQAAHFVECVLRGAPCRSNGVDGARVVDVLQRVDESMRRDGEWIQVPPLSGERRLP